MSQRKTAIAVGILFFVQMFTYMLGASSIQAFQNGETTARPTMGVLLTMLSGLAIVAIGFLMYPVLKQVDRRLAVWYPVLRVVEFAVSAACGVYLLTQLQVVPNNHLWVYIPTGIGGLVLTYLLFVGRLVPRPIAVLGIVGYASLLLGVLLDLLGVLDMVTGAGLVMVAPGGLFEFVVLPIWLIAKGFRLDRRGAHQRNRSWSRRADREPSHPTPDNATFIPLSERRLHHDEHRPAPRAAGSRQGTTADPGHEAGWTVRRAGVVAGVALLVMVPLAAFADFVVVKGMITPGDGPATAAEIVAREGTFRLGVLAWLLVVVLDVVVAWALYRVFRPVSPAVSMLAAVFRFVYAAVLLVAVGHGGAEDLYLNGVLPSGAPLVAERDGGVRIEGKSAACVNCHRRSGLGMIEGRTRIPPSPAAISFTRAPALAKISTCHSSRRCAGIGILTRMRRLRGPSVKASPPTARL